MWSVHIQRKVIESLFFVFVLSCFTGIHGCATHHLPKEPPIKQESLTLPPGETGKLAWLVGEMGEKFGEKASAFLPIDHNDEALHWRLMLADLATSSIDVKYFLWHDDLAGNLLLLRLLDAADRGVRVRFLIDDLDFVDADSDKAIAALDQHPNVKVRIFNPWLARGTTVGRGFEFLGSLDRLNQRMHNKLMVADSHAAIVGGRNIGNDYFGLGKKYNFRDMDLLAVGPVAEELSHTFDLYFNSERVYPGESFSKGEIEPEYLSGIRIDTKGDVEEASKKGIGGFPLYRKDWSSWIERFMQEASSGPVWVVYDEPSSAVSEAGVRVIATLDKLLEDYKPQKEFLIASAYFSPREDLIEDIQQLTDEGIRVVILTNSLASNDVTIANSGYKPWRRAVVEAGAELYELRHDALNRMLSEHPGVTSKFLAFHSKFMVLDRRFCYVGSLNLTYRGVNINTENGLLLDDPVLGARLAEVMERDTRPENSWRVMIDEKNRLMWKSSDRVVYEQPARDFWQRVADGFYSLLPVQDMI